MDITILVDDEKSWFVLYAEELKKQLEKNGNRVYFVHDYREAEGGDVSFLLSCSRIVGKEFLEKYKHNIVVHASDLPKGKGFTPWKWQILEGKNDIVLTLFEAVEKVDAGPYYLKDMVHFNGTELLEDLQRILAEKIIDMCKLYIMQYEKIDAIKQKGEESFYPRFSNEDDKLDIDSTLREQFNHFRIADNERYPLWFSYLGKKYYIKIYCEEGGEY